MIVIRFQRCSSGYSQSAHVPSQSWVGQWKEIQPPASSASLMSWPVNRCSHLRHTRISPSDHQNFNGSCSRKRTSLRPGVSGNDGIAHHGMPIPRLHPINRHCRKVPHDLMTKCALLCRRRPRSRSSKNLLRPLRPFAAKSEAPRPPAKFTDPAKSGQSNQNAQGALRRHAPTIALPAAARPSRLQSQPAFR
jgi:hypothetical protein